MMTVFGEKLPDGALPYAEQVYREPCDITANQTTVDFMVAVYQRYCTGDSSFSLALVDLDRDFNVIPMAAESWEVSEDGLTWTFHLRPGMMWSDDTPVTANDWVQTYRYAADPEHAWDFAWYYAGVIKNWDEVIAGELPLEELGVTAVDDLDAPDRDLQALPAAARHDALCLANAGQGVGRARPVLQQQP